VKASIGFIGLGRMGLPMCRNLVRAGYEVTAGDARPEVAAEARSAGASWAGDTRLVAARADVLITVLPGPEEVREAISDAVASLRPGTTWIDMTSSSPAVGRELGAIVRERGVECVDAPMGGGPPEAEGATLQLFVGGQAEAVERHRRLLEVLGSIEYMGDHCAGYTTKLLVNLLWFGQAVANGEALLLARRAGIDLEVLRGTLGRSAAATEFIRRDVDALLDGDYLESFGLGRCCEELDATVALAGELGVPFELSKHVARAYLRALERYGPVDGELLAVALLEEQAGVHLRRG
jgi:3-hydroxyisobutyrate dehydrogenase